MDVGGAILGGLEDDRVDESDEGGLRDAILGLEVVGVGFLLEERLLLRERCARAEGFGGAREAA